MFGQRHEEEFINDLTQAAATAKSGAWRLILLVLLGLAVFFIWAATFEIEEVTRGTGRVIPSSQIQLVQSLEGGVVRQLAVAEGDLVEAGQVLIEIDDTTLAARRGELLEQEAALMAEEVRLRAEVAFERNPEFSPELIERAGPAVLAEIEVLNSRVEQLDFELDVLRDKLAQRKADLDELRAQRTRFEAILAPLREEATLTEDLAESGAVPRIELLRLRSRLAELEGDLAVAEAQEPTLQAAIREAESQIAVARSSYVLAARQRLARLNVELAVVRENLRAADDRVTRTQLRAPVRGTVNRLNVTTLGEVVQPGAPLAEIVPVDDSLLIEADILPKDVAFISPGERASVKITAYDYLVYGALEGKVVRIGADTVQNAEGREFFQVVIRTDRTDLGREGESLPITPGMVASIDIQTGTRTVLSYLAKPIIRARSEAFRER